jgi:hypothetical protein
VLLVLHSMYELKRARCQDATDPIRPTDPLDRTLILLQNGFWVWIYLNENIDSYHGCFYVTTSRADLPLPVDNCLTSS